MDVLPFIKIGEDMSPMSHRDRRPLFIGSTTVCLFPPNDYTVRMQYFYFSGLSVTLVC